MNEADSKTGKAVADILFKLELLSLGFELTDLFRANLKNSAIEVLESNYFIKTQKKADELFAKKNNKTELLDKTDDLKDSEEILETANFLDDLAGVKTGKRITSRKPSKLEIDNLSKIRGKLGGGVGWNKNVSYSKGKIGDDIIDFQSRSGMPKGTPENFDNFEVIKPENYHYTDGPESIKINHSEQKQIEYLYNKYKHNKLIEGEIEIVSDLKICPNCDYIIGRFSKDFINIKVTKIWVRKELKRLK